MLAATALVPVPRADSIALPQPTGPHAVAASRWMVADPDRAEGFAAAGRRQIEVMVWYPAAERERRPANPYLLSGPDEVRTFATLLGNRTALDDLVDLKSHPAADAPPSPGRDPLPLLLFSHGYTGIPSASTTLLEDLASHGYIVLSIVHPDETIK